MFNRRAFLTHLAGSPLALAQAAGGSSAIWDVHCHLSSTAGETPEERMTHLIGFADRMGIDRVVLSLGYPFVEDPSPQQLREGNDQVLRALDRWPDRSLGLVYLSPNHVDFSLQEFDRCVRDGPMVGVKLWVARRCSAPDLDPIVARAVAMKAVILQHTWLKVGGNLPGESTPHDLVELARRHPQAAFIDAHTGGDWELGIRAIRSARNVSACMAGFDPTSGSVEMAVRELGAERVVYGSDAAGRSFASQLGKVMGAEIPESARRLILGENLRRMLTPILRAKGRHL
ncbi:MAG: amidohydrolase family protein [Acidobacteria bacterium]|nr:amidohydrolase family protein [Acidobacteriota bacterium]